jgi:hypothetical protein
MRVLRVSAIVLIGVAALMAAPAASSPGPPNQDNRIARHPDGPYLGEELYTETGAGQTVRKEGPPGKTLKYFVKIKNLGGTSDIHLDGTGDSKCFRVRYWGGPGYGTNFTSIFVAGTDLANSPGETERVRIDVRIRTCAPVGRVKVVDFDTSPVKPPADFDRVRARTVVVAP